MMEQTLSFFVSNAHAEAAGAASSPPQGGGLSFVLMLVIFFLFLYFAVWRPQNKRAREQQNLLISLVKGDEIVTAGGLLGRITKVTDQYIGVAITNNTEIIMQKSSVITVLPKGTLKTIE
jgi:preprotein translocase subunit YajC